MNQNHRKYTSRPNIHSPHHCRDPTVLHYNPQFGPFYGVGNKEEIEAIMHQLLRENARGMLQMVRDDVEDVL